VHVDVSSAIGLSLRVAAVATALGAVPAIVLAYALARGRFRGRSVLAAAVTAPLVLPPVVTGLFLLRLFGRGGPFGGTLDSIGVPVVFAWPGAVLAALVVGFPLYVLTLRAAVETIDPRYEELSLTLGVPPTRTFLRVTLPLALPGLAAATILAFARALGEFGATVVVAGNVEGRTRTIALAVHALLDDPDGEPHVRALVIASLLLALGSVALHEAFVRHQRRRLGREDD
jgi:molybdate transport system permease protein